MTTDLIIVVISRIFQMGVLLLTLKAMTSELSPAQVGTFSLLVSIATFFTWLTISPVGLYVNRRTLEWLAIGTARRNYGFHACYIAFASLTSAGLLLVAQRLLHPEWGIAPIALAALVSSYMFFSVTNNTLAPFLNIIGRRIAYSILYTLTLLLCLSASWAMVRFHSEGTRWFLGQIIGFAAGGAITLFWFFPAAGNRSRPANSTPPTGAHLRAGLSHALAFVLPVAAALALNWVQFQSYRLIVGELVSLHFLGLFFAGYSVGAGVMGAIEISAAQFFYPYFYKSLQSANDGRGHQSWAVYMSLLLPIILVIVASLIAMEIPLSHLLLSVRFREAGNFITVGAIVEGIRVLGGGYALAAHASMRTRALLLPHATGAVCVVIFTTAGTKLFGEQAIPIAMIAAAVVFLAVMHFAMTRHSGVQLSLYGGYAVMGCMAFLSGLALLVPHLPGGSLVLDFGLLIMTGIVVTGACVLIFLRARNSLARFAP